MSNRLAFIWLFVFLICFVLPSRVVDDKTFIVLGDLSNMKIYSVETRNIRRGEAELDILGETE